MMLSRLLRVAKSSTALSPPSVAAAMAISTTSVAPAFHLHGDQRTAHLKDMDSLRPQMLAGYQAGHTFQHYGSAFIKNVHVEGWRDIALTAGAQPYNKVLVREMGPCSLFLLSWRPGCGSPEHSHPCGGGWIKIVEDQPVTARLTEVRRAHSGKIAMDEYGPATPGTAAFIHNDMGTHMVTNLTTDWVHSLHLYPSA